ncbi:hypothetical protein B0H63DRAFT_477715 [Podospora didyma]|uniref:Uncharacterized protein n=1 Tax=Podospora didyma TaxID=330526 RepID=A0AAE0NCK2_9PEZI|nr:hypothetical protein B0H63DRAFT_477715 [Podospora didyma]
MPLAARRTGRAMTRPLITPRRRRRPSLLLRQHLEPRLRKEGIITVTPMCGLYIYEFSELSLAKLRHQTGSWLSSHFNTTNSSFYNCSCKRSPTSRQQSAIASQIRRIGPQLAAPCSTSLSFKTEYANMPRLAEYSSNVRENKIKSGAPGWCMLLPVGPSGSHQESPTGFSSGSGPSFLDCAAPTLYKMGMCLARIREFWLHVSTHQKPRTNLQANLCRK